MSTESGDLPATWHVPPSSCATSTLSWIIERGLSRDLLRGHDQRGLVRTKNAGLPVTLHRQCVEGTNN